MSHNELVNYYYEKIRKCFEKEMKPQKVKSLSCNNFPVKEVLAKIIEDNNQYLLTDSYLRILAYSCCTWYGERESLYRRLYRIGSNEHIKLVAAMKEYVNRLDDGFNVKHGSIKWILNRLTDEERSLLTTYQDASMVIHRDFLDKVDTYHLQLIRKLLLFVAGACIVDNEWNQYSEYARCIIDNREQISEFLVLQDVDCGNVDVFLEVCPMHNIYYHFKDKTIEKNHIV